jgi:predicted permease
MSLISRFTSLFRSRALDSDLDEEIRSHLEMSSEMNRAAGMSPADARRQALHRFGNPTYMKEEMRRASILQWLDSTLQDVRYAARNLAHTPGFTIVVLLVVALSVAANTAVFSLVNGTLLNPLPYRDPDRLVLVEKSGGASISYPNFRDLQSAATSFEDIALYRYDGTNLEIGGAATRVSACIATADLFRIFDLQPVIGRFFTADDDRVGAEPVVVLGERIWRDRFKSDSGIIGQSINVGGGPHTVIGVAPAYFRIMGGAVDLPLGQWNDKRFQSREGTFGTRAVARIKAGVTDAQVNAELDHIAKDLAAAYPDINSKLRFQLESLVGLDNARIKTIAQLFTVAVVLVLLIACANISTLVLARSSFRRREFAVRLALGARKIRIIRQLLTESLLIAIVGGTAGVLLAQWGLRSALALLPYTLPAHANVRIDLRVLLFAFGVSLVSGALFGILPAILMSHTDVEPELKGAGRATPRGLERTQRWMISCEVAICVVLLTGTGLLLRSLERLSRVELGFDPHNVVVFRVGLTGEALADPARAKLALRRVVDQVSNLPGVEAAAVNLGNLPLTGESDVALWRTDRPRPATQNDMYGAEWYAVSPDYLKTFSIRLLRGRFFNPRDTQESPAVAVVSESLARSVFPNEDPLGKQVHLEFFNETVQIVGVVADVKQFGAAQENVPGLYISLEQMPPSMMTLLGRFSAVALRTRVPVSGLLPALKTAVQSVDPRQVMFSVDTLENMVGSGFFMQRSCGIVLAAFAAFALLLAASGIYGVIAYVITQRTREIGLRIALGARPQAVVQMMLGRGVRMLALGLIAGAAVTPLFVRFVRSMLFGVRAADPVTIGGVAVLMLALGAFAAWVPARHAASISPMMALRDE